MYTIFTGNAKVEKTLGSYIKIRKNNPIVLIKNLLSNGY